MKKKIILALSAIMLLTGCGDISHTSITPVSREDGSGTRGGHRPAYLRPCDRLYG
ncbi:MAG: hypothetical protein IIV62_03630 [Anaerotignum sp.]|nr:hypothetical protein [Anaerotignum sp.]